MNKIELEKKLISENLKAVVVNRAMKYYIDGDKLIKNGDWTNATDVFGIYNMKNIFVFFITDSERGLPNYSKKFSNESDACDALYEYVTLLKRIHGKRLDVKKTL